MLPCLSTIILTYNEEANLPACLESIRVLGSEVFVVDSGSTDRTVEIAKAANALVVEHPFENYAAQRNWAQAHLPLKSEWVLHLDADERLTPELVAEIREKLNVKRETEEIQDQADNWREHRRASKPSGLPVSQRQSMSGTALTGGDRTFSRLRSSVCRSGTAEVDGYLLRKRTIFMGRWIRHGGHYPSYHLRLVRRGLGRCEDRLYDQHFLVDGKVEPLKHDYVDVLTSNLDTWIQRHTRWAELEARQLLVGANGHSQVRPALFGNPIERKRWLRDGLYGRSPLYARAFFYWIYRYFFRLGFLDGKEGFIFHFLQGFWFRLMVDIKIDELRRGQGTGDRGQRSEVRGRRSEVGGRKSENRSQRSEVGRQ